MATKTPIIIAGYSIYCVYALDIQKYNDIDIKQAENGGEIMYLYATGLYKISTSFKTNATIGRAIEDAVSSNIVLSITFQDMGQTVTKNMRIDSFSYSCITLCNKEFWDIQLSLIETR